MPGAAAALHTSLRDGVDEGEGGEAGLAARRAAFGANRFKAVPPKNFFKLWAGNLLDPTLIMLMAAAMVRGVRGGCARAGRVGGRAGAYAPPLDPPAAPPPPPCGTIRPTPHHPSLYPPLGRACLPARRSPQSSVRLCPLSASRRRTQRASPSG